MARPYSKDKRKQLPVRARTSIIDLIKETMPKRPPGPKKESMTFGRRVESLILAGLETEGHGDRIRALGITPCVRETVHVRMGTEEQLARMPPTAKPEAHCDYFEGQGEKGDQTTPETSTAKHPPSEGDDLHG